ncbi:hypothetical protein WJX82_008711 [Trebouxia sp. C0006]
MCTRPAGNLGSCGQECLNQRIRKGLHAKTSVFDAGLKGRGLRAAEDLEVGKLVAEYVGEVISADEAAKRCDEYEEQRIKHMYLFQTRNGALIDATRKGNDARFINHSCEPNCQAEYWTVEGRECVGIFTIQTIKAGEEVTYDYHSICAGEPVVTCLCGSAECRGFLDSAMPGQTHHRKRPFSAMVGEELRARPGFGDGPQSSRNQGLTMSTENATSSHARQPSGGATSKSSSKCSCLAKRRSHSSIKAGSSNATNSASRGSVKASAGGPAKSAITHSSKAAGQSRAEDGIISMPSLKGSWAGTGVRTAVSKKQRTDRRHAWGFSLADHAAIPHAASAFPAKTARLSPPCEQRTAHVSMRARLASARDMSLSPTRRQAHAALPQHANPLTTESPLMPAPSPSSGFKSSAAQEQGFLATVPEQSRSAPVPVAPTLQHEAAGRAVPLLPPMGKQQSGRALAVANRQQAAWPTASAKGSAPVTDVATPATLQVGKAVDSMSHASQSRQSGAPANLTANLPGGGGSSSVSVAPGASGTASALSGFKASAAAGTSAGAGKSTASIAVVPQAATELSQSVDSSRDAEAAQAMPPPPQRSSLQLPQAAVARQQGPAARPCSSDMPPPPPRPSTALQPRPMADAAGSSSESDIDVDIDLDDSCVKNSRHGVKPPLYPAKRVKSPDGGGSSTLQASAGHAAGAAATHTPSIVNNATYTAAEPEMGATAPTQGAPDKPDATVGATPSGTCAHAGATAEAAVASCTGVDEGLVPGVIPHSEADAPRHQSLAEHHSNRLGIISLDDSATAEASHATREEQARTVAEAERQAEIKRQLVALYDAHISASLSERSAHKSVPHQVRPQEQSCTPASSSGGPGCASVEGHTSAAAPTNSASQDATPHAQSQALVTDQAAAGAASEQGANTGSQGQKKKRRKLLVNLNRGAEPKASHATSDAAVSLMPDPTASSHHAARAQTGGELCNMTVLEPVQGDPQKPDCEEEAHRSSPQTSTRRSGRRVDTFAILAHQEAAKTAVTAAKSTADINLVMRQGALSQPQATAGVGNAQAAQPGTQGQKRKRRLLLAPMDRDMERTVPPVSLGSEGAVQAQPVPSSHADAAAQPEGFPLQSTSQAGPDASIPSALTEQVTQGASSLMAVGSVTAAARQDQALFGGTVNDQENAHGEPVFQNRQPDVTSPPPSEVVDIGREYRVPIVFCEEEHSLPCTSQALNQAARVAVPQHAGAGSQSGSKPVSLRNPTLGELAEVIYKEGWMPLVLCDNEGSPLEGDGGDIMAQCPTEQQDALFTTPAHLGGSGVGNETMTAIAEQDPWLPLVPHAPKQNLRAWKTVPSACPQDDEDP